MDGKVLKLLLKVGGFIFSLKNQIAVGVNDRRKKVASTDATFPIELLYYQYNTDDLFHHLLQHHNSNCLPKY